MYKFTEISVLVLCFVFFSSRVAFFFPLLSSWLVGLEPELTPKLRHN